MPCALHCLCWQKGPHKRSPGSGIGRFSTWSVTMSHPSRTPIWTYIEASEDYLIAASMQRNIVWLVPVLSAQLPKTLRSNG